MFLSADQRYGPHRRSNDIGSASILTKELQFELPTELIAQRPCEPRDASRLMVVYRASGAIEHRVFRDLPDYLDPRDTLVLNRTRVLPAKIAARRTTGGRIDGLFIREIRHGHWEVMLNGLRRVKIRESLTLNAEPLRGDAENRAWRMTLVRRIERGLCEVSVEPADSAARVLDVIGAMPLPPYIHREADDRLEFDALDRDRYQTVFAREPGAVAAPTAGLHFTRELLERIGAMGVESVDVVLHVGMGTFQPVEVENLADHVMHKEWFKLAPESAARLRERRAAGGRIVAVGTTSVRVLESCSDHGQPSGREGWTDLLIYPPYSFRATDALVTNFHLPGSTLLALVAAFAGLPLMRKAYAEAIAERYRFFSYGDAMLIV